MRLTSLTLTTVLAASVLALSGCGGNAGGNDAGSSAGSGGENGITIGIKYDQPGLGFMEGDTPSGFDVEVAKAVAAKLGFSAEEIKWREAPTPQRETLLETGQIDMAVASYSISDKRKERVQFAGPYLVAGQDVLVAADNTDIAGPETLEGKILCSLTGSTSAVNVKKAVPGVQLQEYGTASECVEQVANGTIDAFSTDDAILAGYAAQDSYSGKLKIVGKPFSQELYGIGLAKDNQRCEEINQIITGLWDDGTIKEIVAKHFGPANYTPNAELNPPKVGGHCS